MNKVGFRKRVAQPEGKQIKSRGHRGNDLTGISLWCHRVIRQGDKKTQYQREVVLTNTVRRPSGILLFDYRWIDNSYLLGWYLFFVKKFYKLLKLSLSLEQQ